MNNRVSSAVLAATALLGVNLGHNAVTRSIRPRVTNPRNHNVSNYGVSRYVG